MFKIQTHYKVVAITAFVLALGFLSGGKAHAASITVSTDTNPSPCTLDEAIININNQAQTNTDCVETGSFGTNDAINIPSGVVALSSPMTTVTRSMTITGAGMGVTTIDGINATYDHINVQGTGSEQFSLHGLTLKNLHYMGVWVADANFVADQLEVYGSADANTPSFDMKEGIVFQNNLPARSLEVSLSNIHVHHLQDNGAQSAENGILISGNSAAGSTNVNMNNITVNGLHTSTAFIVNGIVFSMFNGVAHTMTANISNVTVTDIENTAASLTAIALVDTGNGTGTLNMDNITISKAHGSAGAFGGSGGIVSGASGSSATSTISARNVVVSDVLSDGLPAGCLKADVTSIFGGSGVPILSLNSSGGNISDDNTCKDYFNQSSDQNNFTTLGSTLGSLSDNGGYVPTIPLLQGSPAIDAGVTVVGLTADARLVARPQGTAYDSGAYESPYSKPPPATLAKSGSNSLVALFGIVPILGLAMLSRERLAYKTTR